MNVTTLNLDRNVSDGSHTGADNVMAVAEKMHWISSSFAGTIFLIFGLAGNTMSLIIWCKKAKNSSTEMYLIAQSISDIGVLVFFFLTDSLTMIRPSIKESYTYGVFYSYVGYPIFYFFIANSIWNLVGVTVDRYINVCWYKQAKSLCSHKMAVTGILLISFLCFIINTPHFGSYYPIPAADRDAGTPAYNATEFGKGKGSQMYEFWVHCMFLVLVPWITILCLNLTIICRVTKLNKQMYDKRGMEAKERALRHENQLTKLLLCVTFTFLVLIIFQCVTQCFYMLEPEMANMRVVDEAYAIAKLGVIINSSINFILYCVSGQWFRKELAMVLNKICGCKQLVPVPGYYESYSIPDTTTSTNVKTDLTTM